MSHESVPPNSAIQLAPDASIPVIEFSGFTGADATARRQTADGIRRSFAEYGFLHLRHHGVAEEIVDDLFEPAQMFYSRPGNIKAQAAGYTHLAFADWTRPSQRTSRNVSVIPTAHL